MPRIPTRKSSSSYEMKQPLLADMLPHELALRHELCGKHQDCSSSKALQTYQHLKALRVLRSRSDELCQKLYKGEQAQAIKTITAIDRFYLSSEGDGSGSGSMTRSPTRARKKNRDPTMRHRTCNESGDGCRFVAERPSLDDLRSVSLVERCEQLSPPLLQALDAAIKKIDVSSSEVAYERVVDSLVLDDAPECQLFTPIRRFAGRHAFGQDDVGKPLTISHGNTRVEVGRETRLVRFTDMLPVEVTQSTIMAVDESSPSQSFITVEGGVKIHNPMRTIDDAFDREVDEGAILSHEEAKAHEVLSWLNKLAQLLRRRRINGLGFPATAHGLWPCIVQRCDEIYQLAEWATAPFQRLVEKLVEQYETADGGTHTINLKSPIRVHEKAMEDYIYSHDDSVIPEANVVDVLRARVILKDTSLLNVPDLMRFIDKEFSDEESANGLKISVVRLKNVFDPRHTGAFNMRFMVLNIVVEDVATGKHAICELQLFGYKMHRCFQENDSHAHYVYFRSSMGLPAAAIYNDEELAHLAQHTLPMYEQISQLSSELRLPADLLQQALRATEERLPYDLYEVCHLAMDWHLHFLVGAGRQGGSAREVQPVKAMLRALACSVHRRIAHGVADGLRFSAEEAEEALRAEDERLDAPMSVLTQWHTLVASETAGVPLLVRKSGAYMFAHGAFQEALVVEALVSEGADGPLGKELLLPAAPVDDLMQHLPSTDDERHRAAAFALYCRAAFHVPPVASKGYDSFMHLAQPANLLGAVIDVGENNHHALFFKIHRETDEMRVL